VVAGLESNRLTHEEYAPRRRLNVGSLLRVGVGTDAAYVAVLVTQLRDRC
jgi:hypothetical protein